MKRKPNNRRGFSLMELLAVMAIMGLLATVAVTGYFSAVRGMTRRRAASNLMAALVQARQRACIEGSRTALICYNVKTDSRGSASDLTSVSPSYVVCKALGRLTYVQGNNIGDEFTPLNIIFGSFSSALGSGTADLSFGSRRIYNISGAGWTDVNIEVTPGGYKDQIESPLTGENYRNPNLLWCFTRASQGSGTAQWRVGDQYGVEVTPPSMLPKNVYFSELQASDKTQINVMFYPDGRATPKNIQLMAPDLKTFATITVEANGNVKGGKEIKLD